MKRNLKRLVALLLSMAMLTGCNQNKQDPETDPSQETQSEAIGDEVWDDVVARCGDHEMTNALLSYYFWSGYGAFLNYYESDAQGILDLYTPLNQQWYSEDKTWEEFFVDNAMTAFRQYCAICDLAAEQGFTLSESNQKMLDNLEMELTATAADLGFTTGMEYLQTNFGPGVSLESYGEYLKTYMTVLEYVAKAQDQFPFTPEQVEENYDNNAESYAAAGIEKDDRNMVSLRYLTLFEYDNEWETSDGQVISSAEDVFNQLLVEWENSADHSEEAFMKLGESWVDFGVQQNYVEQMSTASNNEQLIIDWAFEEGRQPGDYYAMASDAGYFLLYFVKTCDTTYWYEQSLYDLQYTAFSETVDAKIQQMKFSESPELIVIAESPDMYEAS